MMKFLSAFNKWEGIERNTRIEDVSRIEQAGPELRWFYVGFEPLIRLEIAGMRGLVNEMPALHSPLVSSKHKNRKKNSK